MCRNEQQVLSPTGKSRNELPDVRERSSWNSPRVRRLMRRRIAVAMKNEHKSEPAFYGGELT